MLKKKPYKYIDHPADVGIVVIGNTLKQLFQNAGWAMFDIIAGISTIFPIVEQNVDIKYIPVEKEKYEEILNIWLSELLQIFYTKNILLANFEIDEMSPSRLIAVVKGEKFQAIKHRILTEIKAVTFHEMNIIKKNNNYEVQIIFDV